MSWAKSFREAICVSCGHFVDREAERWVESYRGPSKETPSPSHRKRRIFKKWAKVHEVARHAREGLTGVMHKSCDDERREQEFARTGFLSTWLVDHAQLAAYYAERRDYGNGNVREAEPISDTLRRVDEAATRLGAQVKEFEARIWHEGGMQKLVEEAPTQVRLDHFTLTILTLCSAGRIMLTIEDTTLAGSVTLLVHETYKGERDEGEGEDEVSKCTMYLRGIQATEKQASELLNRATRAWLEGARFVPSTGTSLL